MVDDHLPASSKAKTVSVRLDGVDRVLVANHYGLWGMMEPAWPVVHLFTDGSWHARHAATPAVSSWAVCVGNDWLMESYPDVEAEGRISAVTLSQSLVLCGRIDESVGAGNYDAELTAIAWALMMVPAGCGVVIHTDSRSSLQAIDGYKASTNTRRRLRMAGRPLLALITRLIDAKRLVGGMALVRWVKAHSERSRVEEVGNRLADEVAGRVCDVKRVVRQRCTATLPLDLQERFVAVHVHGLGERDGGPGRVLTNDPRRAAQSALQVECRATWAASRSQSAFSGALIGATALWQFVGRHGRQACGFVMLALSNILEWRRAEPEEKNSPTVVEERCPLCKSINSIDHLVDCLRWEGDRERAMDAMMVTWNQGTGMVLRRGADTTLRTMVVAMGLVDGRSGRCAITAACFGAFDDSTVVRVLRRWAGVRDDEERIIDELRWSLVNWAFDAHQAGMTVD